MLTLVTLSNLNEAHLLRSMLAARDIPAFIPDENTCQADWGYINALGGVRVQVPEGFAPEATRILNDFKANSSRDVPDVIGNQWESPATPNIAPLATALPQEVPRKDSGWKPMLPVIIFFAILGAVALHQYRVLRSSTALDQGNAAYAEGAYALAIEAYTRALASSPRDERAYVMRGLAHDDLREFDAALADYTRAIALDPKDEYAWVNRGRVYWEKGDAPHSLADSKQALLLDPSDQQAYFNRGDTYLAQDKFADAIQDFTQAILIDSTDANAYLNRAGAYDDTGESEKAMADYATVIQLNPQGRDAYNSLAWDLATSPQAALRDGKKALGLAGRACDLSDWKDGFALDTLAAACAESGDFASAVRWENAAMLRPGPDAASLAEFSKRMSLYEAHQPYRRNENQPGHSGFSP